MPNQISMLECRIAAIVRSVMGILVFYFIAMDHHLEICIRIFVMDKEPICNCVKIVSLLLRST